MTQCINNIHNHVKPVNTSYFIIIFVSICVYIFIYIAFSVLKSAGHSSWNFVYVSSLVLNLEKPKVIFLILRHRRSDICSLQALLYIRDVFSIFFLVINVTVNVCTSNRIQR